MTQMHHTKVCLIPILSQEASGTKPCIVYENVEWDALAEEQVCCRLDFGEAVQVQREEFDLRWMLRTKQ